MSVGKICQRNVDVITPDDPIRTAAKRMAKRRVGSLVVLGAGEKPVGIVTDRDIVVRVLGDDRDPDHTAVADVMTREPSVISEFTPVEEALTTMRTLGVRRLPVTGSDGRLVGIISIDDFVRFLVGELGDIGQVLEKEAPHGGVLV